MSPPVRVLVVDDSAFARKVMREVLSGADGIEVVGTARDGIDALERIAELHPDVITLDLMMPGLDGVGVLRALANLPRRPSVVVVSMSDEDSEIGVAALAEGAFDVVKKPTALATDRLYDLSDELRAKVRLAASHAPKPAPARTASPATTPAPARRDARARVVAIGASTGGPQALTQLIQSLPADFPVPVLIVLHMPAGYTEAFARRLDGDCALDVFEARQGMVLAPGMVVVARAGMHLTVLAEGDRRVTELAIAPIDTPHRPSVDVLFESCAALYARGVLGVVLTGMGADGLAGARAICAAGGRMLTESESSCVVYGMPRAVAEAGLSSAEAPIGAMANLILEHL
jgi:two-component system, chemotaxis family, protein-glutamate methylesterase/glutaminase